MMLSGYRDPKSYTPEGIYPDDWSPLERIHPPEWRGYQAQDAPEWLNATEFLLDKHIQDSSTAQKPAIIADDVPYSYEYLLKLVCRAAHALTEELQLDSDNRLLIIAPDRIEAVLTWLGAHRAGVVPGWVSPLYKPRELAYFIEDTACRALFIDAGSLGKFREIQAELPSALKHVIVYGSGEEVGRSYHELVDSMPETFEPHRKHVDDFSYLFYSGGTTGKAKCIVHTVRDFTWVPQSFVTFMEWKSEYVHYDTSPKFHTHGIWPGVLIPLWNGATTVLVSDRLSPNLVVETVQKYRPQVLTTVPTVLKWLVAYPSEQGTRPDFSSLNMVHSAAEKIPMAIHEKFLEIYDLEVFDSIGSSEIAYEWLANRPTEHKMGSAGKPIFNCEALLVDPDTMEIIREPHQQGEIWVKSDGVLFFYWRKYHKTKDCLVGPWMRTGDVAYFDEDGFLFHVSRVDDVFKVSGMWVSPLEVEDSLLTHEAVQDAAVIPKKSESEGLTYPKAFIVLSPGWRLTDELVRELQKRVRDDIGGYKSPRWIESIDEIPSTTFQKISRVTLRQKETG